MCIRDRVSTQSTWGYLQFFIILLHTFWEKYSQKQIIIYLYIKNIFIDFYMEKQAFDFKELVRIKKANGSLTEPLIQQWIKGVCDGSVPDYQTTALLMAIFWRGMNVKERSYLTKAMALSGDKMDYSDVKGFKIDKHSSGGIGDKTSLILAPLMGVLGMKTPMVAGRGLGHTGGTIDKLESIKGFRTDLSFDEMKQMIKNIGCFINAQTSNLAPADKKIYALRDATEIVDEISLITSSILSKKFAEGIQGLTMDVKCGPSAFMKDLDQAQGLATSLVSTANAGGVKCEALITRMEYPLGEQIGNNNEVWECVEAMTPNSSYIKILQEKILYDPQSECLLKPITITSNKDILIFITAALALNMMKLAGSTDLEQDLKKIKKVWSEGQVLEHFKKIVELQHGSWKDYVQRSSKIMSELKNDHSPNVFIFRSDKKCKISKLDGEKLGNLMILFGAGRKVAADKIDFDSSMEFLAYPNQQLENGTVIAKIYVKDPSLFQKVKIQEKLKECFTFTEDQSYQDKTPLVLKVVKDK
eukprot:TRINITY_DN31_c0_g1_i1.p1 TRINITY_DN31_c0_g1~~TRINITY_DN31_c0_g1_i1.p1  ORF type:complete len:529 (+),score=110.20 TRINITY_DN31_c0_g1_i1:198-1784(+)